MGIETAALTDTGRVRDHNEDSVCVAPTSAGRLLAVADGMGGHNAGAVASEIALETFVAEVGDRLADRRRPAWTDRHGDRLSAFEAALDGFEHPVPWDEVRAELERHRPSVDGPA